MVYYDVGGTTAAQLRAQLSARAPRSPDGFRGDAFTRWQFRWSWPGYGSTSCRLSKATVTLRVMVSFPRWTHPRAVVRAIRHATCGTADAAARKQLNLIRKHDVAYDASTQHGATQGARFP